MTADPTLARRFARLENDSESTYELVSAIAKTQRAHTRRFQRVENRLDGVENRLEGVEDGLGEVRATLEQVVIKLDDVARRLPDPA